MLIAIFVSIAGVFLIFNPFAANADMKGVFLAFGAAVTFSFYSVINKTRVKKYGGLVLTSFCFIIGNIFLLICLLIFKIPVVSGITGNNVLHILYLGIFVTGIGYLFYFEAMKHTSAITASMVFLIKPALAPFLSLLVLGESISVNTILGICCIVAASLTVFLPGRR